MNCRGEAIVTTVTEQASISTVPVAVGSKVALKGEVLTNGSGGVDAEGFPREK